MTAAKYLKAANRLMVEEDTDLWTALMRVLLIKLRTVRLPDELLPSLGQADRYWNTGEGDLTNAKSTVWRHIERNYPKGTDLGVSEGRAACALLCVLEPKGDDETRSMTAEWFAVMIESGL
jgi:hypothetical protein